MIWSIICLIFGAIVALEIIYQIATSASASDFTYFICRPFGIEMSMLAGFINRIILIALAGAAIYYGISTLI